MTTQLREQVTISSSKANVSAMSERQSRVLSEDAPLDLRLSEPELERTRENITSFISDTVEEALAVQRVIHGIYDSSKKGGPVTLED